MELPPALLFGGEQIAVSAARSVAALGAQVHAVGEASDPVRVSRHCSSYAVVPRAKGRADRYLEFLECDAPRGAVLLPCDDESLEVIARNRAQLEEWGFKPVEANDDVLLAMLDKERTYELSRSLGVPTPRTLTVRTRDEAARAATELGFPCALKPLHSHLFSEIVGMTAKVYVAHDAEELLHWFAIAEGIGIEMLVTEIVPGRDDDFCSYYTYMLPDGQPLFHLTKHKLRQLPIGFGLTCYQETVWEPEVVDVGSRFCRGVGLVGVAAVEFKRDPRDGAWKIIECNHRFTLANEVVRLSGIDLPAIAYSRVAGLQVAPIQGYRVGVRMWNPIEDAKAMRHYRAAGELTVGAWLRSLFTRWHFSMWCLSDPLPTYDRVVRYRLPDVARQARRRLAARVRAKLGR